MRIMAAGGRGVLRPLGQQQGDKVFWRKPVWPVRIVPANTGGDDKGSAFLQTVVAVSAFV